MYTLLNTNQALNNVYDTEVFTCSLCDTVACDFEINSQTRDTGEIALGLEQMARHDLMLLDISSVLIRIAITAITILYATVFKAVDFLVTLLSMKFSSSNSLFISIHCIGTNLKTINAKIFSKFTSTKYKSLTNYLLHIHIVWYYLS